MLMWPTNTAAVEAFEFRSEESSSLRITSRHIFSGRGGVWIELYAHAEQDVLRSLTLKC